MAGRLGPPAKALKIILFALTLPGSALSNDT